MASGYWIEIDYKKFRKIMEERIKNEKRLYEYYLKRSRQTESETVRKMYEEKAGEHYVIYMQDLMLLEMASGLKDECLFFYDLANCSPVLIRVGKTVKKERERLLKENFQMMYR